MKTKIIILVIAIITSFGKSFGQSSTSIDSLENQLSLIETKISILEQTKQDLKLEIERLKIQPDQVILVKSKHSECTGEFEAIYHPSLKNIYVEVITYDLGNSKYVEKNREKKIYSGGILKLKESCNLIFFDTNGNVLEYEILDI